MSSTKQFQVAFTFFVVVAVVCFIFGITFFCMNNAWFSEKGVLGELKKQDSAIVRIVYTQRNFLAKSLILVEKVGGVQQMYFLDTDIGFAYRLTAVK